MNKQATNASPENQPRFIRAATLRYSKVVRTKPEAVLVGDVDIYGESYVSIDYDFQSLNENSYMCQSEFFGQNDYPEVGAAESCIPVYGSGKQMINDINDGDYGGAMLSGAATVSDLFLMKSIVQGIGKGGIKMLSKKYKNWGSWRKEYGKMKFAEKYQEVHHCFMLRDGATSGSGFNWWVKNQKWNLLPMKPATIDGVRYTAEQLHYGLHYKGVLKNMSKWQRYIYGSPTWVKPATTSTMLHFPLMFDE